MTEENRPDDSARIELYLKGDEAAYREVESWIRGQIEILYPSLRSEAEDLSQGVHAKLVASLRAGRFQGRSSLKTYVAGITHYTAIDRIRQLYRDRALLPGWDTSAEGAQENPYQALANVQEEQMLHFVVQRAPDACRELWRLVFLERLTYVEIGRRLSLPPGTVKSRMWYCRRKVMALLEKLKQPRVLRSQHPERR